MNGCKASYRSWVREQEQSCAQLRREAGCPPDAYEAVQWHIHGTKAGQTIGVHRAVYRTCDVTAGDEGTNARADEASQVLDRETRSRVQSALAMQGFDPGPPDGVFGPRTRGAIQSWQQASGYAATGELTDEQAERLLEGEALAEFAAPVARGGQFGSIAFSQLEAGGYALAIAWNEGGREAARRSALDECRRQGGGSGCHEAGWFQNGCGAIAIGDRNGYGTAGGRAQKRRRARRCRIAGL